MKYSKAFVVALLMVWCVAALAHPVKHGRKTPRPQIERVVAAAPNVAVSVCVLSGDIKVRGWDRNQVRARSTDAPEIELRRSGARETESAKEIIVLISDQERRPTSSCNADIDIEIDVPRGATVKVQTRDGDISVTDVSTVQANTLNGDIDLESVKGSVDANTLGGDVSIRNSSGTAKLHSVSGTISATSVGPAAVGDKFEADTVGGDITIDKASYLKLDVGSIDGILNVNGPLPRGGRYQFRTISGDIHLLLPADSSFRLEAKLSRNAELVTDFPLKMNTGSDQPPPKVSPPSPGKRDMTPDPDDLVKGAAYGMQHIGGVYGTGDALINISSFSGSAYLRKK